MNPRLRVCASVCVVLSGFASPASAELIHAIAQQGVQQNLITFDSSVPSNILTSQFLGISDVLGENQPILAMDFRPADKKIYALSNQGSQVRLRTINAGPGSVGNPFSVAGVHFGFDFNPTLDLARAVSETNTNIVINPNTGIPTTATALAYAAGDPNFGKDPNVVDIAYDNNVAGALTSQLYGIDTNLNVLVKQANNTGVLTTVGPLGVDPIAVGGFDVSWRTGIAYAVLEPVGSGQASLYTINLLTGAANNVGVVDGGLTITALTVGPVPEPTTAGLMLSALLAFAGIRRRVA